MKKWPWFLLSILIIALDQLTKLWAGGALVPYEPVNVMPMLNLTLAFNTGAAFSFMSTGGLWSRWFFSGFSFVVSILLVSWLLRTPVKQRLQLTAISLILGGAIGNFYDRAFNGYVIDFIDLFYRQHHWPIFNVADMAICTGAFLLLVDLFFAKKEISTDSDY